MRPKHLSYRGLRFIARFEGFVNHPYNDPANNATIGYGHLLHTGPVTPGDVSHWGHISTAEGERLLLQDVKRCELAVSQWVDPPLRFPWRFDALVSFTFNLGTGILSPEHTIGRLLHGSRLRRGVADAFLLYDKDYHGNRLPGLTARRQAERRLWLYGRYR